MEIKNYTVKNQEDVFCFFLYLLRDLGINFNPDTPFLDYTDLQGNPIFSEVQANQLDVMMYSANHVMGYSGAQDIYFFANLARHFNSLYALSDKMRPLLKEQGWEKVVKVIDEQINQIKATYFDVLKPEPYLTNWSLKEALRYKKLDKANVYDIQPYEDGGVFRDVSYQLTKHPHSVQVSFYEKESFGQRRLNDTYVYNDPTSALADITELIKFGLPLIEKE